MNRKSFSFAAVVVVAVVFLILAVRFQKHRQAERRLTVVDQIVSHALSANADGRVALPDPLNGTSVDDCAYLAYDADGSFTLFFPSWRGKGSSSVGPVYSSRTYGTVPRTLKVMLPVPNIKPDPQYPAAPIDVPVDQRLDDHWFMVRWDLD